MTIAIALAALCLVLLYAWIGFPLALGLWARLARSRAGDEVTPPGADDHRPPVFVLFSAYNEEAHVARRIRNVLEADYPAGLLQVLVGVDGATDGTAGQARSAASADARVRVHAFPRNRGKVAVLKDLVRLSADTGAPGAAGSEDGAGPAPILVLTDANTVFRTDTLRRLVAPLSDPRVGAVCGRLVFLDGKGAETHESAYWQWETRLKQAESALDSCLGANGAVYAMRRELFWTELPDNTVVDDFVIGMKVREQGHRVVYEPAAVACEDLPETVEDEWVRRVRIGSGGFQSMRYCAACLSPRYGRFAWMFWSHKVLRWLTPHLLLMALAVAFTGLVPTLCLRQPAATLAAVASAAVLVLTVLALIAFLVGRLTAGMRSAALVPFQGLAYFLSMQAAIFVGFLRFCRGDLKGSWVRTRR